MTAIQSYPSVCQPAAPQPASGAPHQVAGAPHPAAAAPHPAAERAGPLDLTPIRRILAVRPDNLGDVVLLTPALRALRAAAAPGCRLELLTSPAGSTVVPLIDSVDEALVETSVCWQDADGRPVDPAAQLALVRRLADRHYDLAVIFTSFSQSPWPAAFVCALAGIAVRVGASREFGGGLLTHWTDSLPDGIHQADRALALLARFGVPGSDPRLSVRVPVDAAARARRLVTRRITAGPEPAVPGLPPGAYAVVLPGATCSARRYPVERFAAVVARLAAAGLPVLVVGTEPETDLVHQVAGAPGTGPQARPQACAAGLPEAAPVVGLAGVLDVPTLAAVLRDAAVVVTNNSGGAHLADAVRAPVVTLFAGTELESEYRPRSGPNVVLHRPTPCSPCRAFTCHYRHECLDVPPAEVADAALGLAATGVNRAAVNRAGAA